MIPSLFLITGLIFLVFAGIAGVRENSNPITKLSTIIFIIAGSTYLLMSCLYLNGTTIPARVLRYIDWFLTIPLMIGQLGYFFTGGFNLRRAILPVVYTLFMLGAGLAGELGFNPEWGIVKDGQFWDLRQHEYKIVLGMIGVGFMSNLFIQIARCLGSANLKLYLKILGLWLFYPVVYFLPETPTTLLLYSIVDLLAKVAISFVLHKQHKLEDESCAIN
jgi:bacteriorhodopsin